ncbi:hypothetical protein [Arthrobacter sp. ISL-95]|uniref:hypothetical protein n=1 Tax=Arthrobacter sp. ISL-95 TaxID=2819116 RepID=UPI001BE54588|nr:hypothetical protein [Arthrobacter sp. ISL-95]MBT2587903.1 hypothetical protein [Arthrobacter sp. ISL-95]
MNPRLQFDSVQLLDAFEAAIRPLDETASSMTLNDRLLDLLIDELLPTDDPARSFVLEPWMVLIDVLDAEAYELAMTIDDKDQAGHSWSTLLDQLNSARFAALEAVAA